MSVDCSYLNGHWRKKAWSVQCGLTFTPRRLGARPMFASRMSVAKKAGKVEQGDAEEHNRPLPPHGQQAVAAAAPLQTRTAAK